MLETTSKAASLRADLSGIVGDSHVLTGPDAAPWAQDWTGLYKGVPLAVVRPANTGEVSALMQYAAATRLPVVPVAGNTGLTGGSMAQDALVISVERLSRIREMNPSGRSITVEAGLLVDLIDQAAEAHGLTFPLKFGASGSARIGGALSTNAGGANVLRYGTARELCLGIEAVMPDGAVIDLLTPLRKDNTGFDLRNLLIGAEGQLGIITAATLKLFPRPTSHATALIALPDLAPAPQLLNVIQDACGGVVEAFEYMSGSYLRELRKRDRGHKIGFETLPDHCILLELASAGKTLSSEDLEPVLVKGFEAGWIQDALIAQNEAQRQEFWILREISAELCFDHPRAIDTDIAVPLDQIASYLANIGKALQNRDPGCLEMTVGHLGDGNLHVAVHPVSKDPKVVAGLQSLIEDQAVALKGTFSAEHGVGLSKLDAMRRHKTPAQLATLRAIKTSLDPLGLLNPGKTIP